MKIATCALCLMGITAVASAADRITGGAPVTADDYLRVIRSNDLKALKEMSRAGVSDVRDRLDWSPLHYAALFGSVDSVRIMLAAGADPNSRNKSQATPLMFGAYDLEKTRLLVEKGADVNAKAADGSTPLYVATGVHGNNATIRYLLEKGADPKTLRNDADYLTRVANSQDAEMVRLFLDRGLDPHRISSGGINALEVSLTCDGGAKAQLLLAAGSDVNVANKTAGTVKNGPIESTGITPLMRAATCGQPATVAALLKAGARINTLDDRKMSALMMAAATDNANPEVVRMLLAAGADVKFADKYQDTALDWARRFRNPQIVAMLEKAGAPEKGLTPIPNRPADYKPDAKTAIANASSLLAKSAEVFFVEGGGCVGCHHQPFAARAFGAAKVAGLPAEPRLRMALVNGEVPEKARRTGTLPLMVGGGGGADSFLYALAGLGDTREPGSMLTDMMVHFIAQVQDPSGGWTSFGARPPLQASNITRTMLAIQALKNYSWPARRLEFDARIARARTWLLNATPETTLDIADAMLGLWLAGADPADVRKFAQRLMKEQRADGGWAQTANLDSDAFGTSAALYSLRRAGMLKETDAAYQKGTRYLLDTQYPDGSWYVRSRAVKLQPYFQSAFPYDHDQWISNSATGYAVMALAPTAAR